MGRGPMPIAYLDRLGCELARFMEFADVFYPGLNEDMADRGDDATETIRNAATALAHVQCWAAYRRQHRRDPFDFQRVASDRREPEENR